MRRVNRDRGPQPLDIAQYWADLNEHLCELLEAIPDARLDEAPPDEWGVRAVVRHIIGGREHWLEHSLGREAGSIPPRGASVHDLQSALRTSWERMLSFITDAEALDAEYEPPAGDPVYVDPPELRGHYVAFHRLAHDVHHRAQLLDRMRDLGLEIPEASRRRPL